MDRTRAGARAPTRPGDPSPLQPTRCPICRAKAEPRPTNRAAPFCSERCKLADLGNWLEARYVVPGAPLLDDDLVGVDRQRSDHE